jgi:hypothetical protein
VSPGGFLLGLRPGKAARPAEPERRISDRRHTGAGRFDAWSWARILLAI